MTHEHMATDWLDSAQEKACSGQLDDAIAQELFDHTWKISAIQISRILRLRSGDRVLDAGAGWGRLIHALKYHDRSLCIDGYELTPERAERARRLLQESGLAEGVHIVEADLISAAIPQARYDAFYSSRVLHYIDDKPTVLAKLHASLKPGGRGLIILPNRNCPYRWLTYHHGPLFPISQVGRLMKATGFRNITYGGFGFIPPFRRFSADSFAGRLDLALARTPLCHFAGLAYVVGESAP
jgi:ubiquinone/menaquinone biosynthesis C-methylase UbiE